MITSCKNFTVYKKYLINLYMKKKTEKVTKNKKKSINPHGKDGTSNYLYLFYSLIYIFDK